MLRPFLTLTLPFSSKLLEFPLQDHARLTLGPATFEIDLPDYANFPLSASDHFLYLDGGIDRVFGNLYEPVVIDVRTRAMYQFPVFSSGLVSSHVVVDLGYMLISVAGRGYPRGAPSMVARVHPAVRQTYHRFSSLAALGPSCNSHSGVRYSRFVGSLV